MISDAMLVLYPILNKMMLMMSVKIWLKKKKQLKEYFPHHNIYSLFCQKITIVCGFTNADNVTDIAFL